MFLPPGGDGNPNSSELKQVTSTILTFVAIILFFLSPLGSIFFALFNSLVAFLILAPLAAVAAFNIWEYVNTLSGTCPNCQAPVTVLKNEVPTICYNCGAIVQAKEGQIYLASQNKNIYSTNDVDDLLPMNRNMFTTIVEELTTVFTGTPSSDDDDDDPLDISNTTPRSASSSSSSSKNRSNQQNTIIDVKVVNDDWPTPIHEPTNERHFHDTHTRTQLRNNTPSWWWFVSYIYKTSRSNQQN